jgi:hypothetical protein
LKRRVSKGEVVEASGGPAWAPYVLELEVGLSLAETADRVDHDLRPELLKLAAAQTAPTRPSNTSSSPPPNPDPARRRADRRFGLADDTPWASFLASFCVSSNRR